jgi:signal transduction histidine kinase
MHGSVRVEDTEGGGATFIVELPKARVLLESQLA